MEEEKRLLTEEIAWKDLMALKGGRVHSGRALSLIPAVGLAVFHAFITILMLKDNTRGWQVFLILTLIYGFVTRGLYRRYRAAVKKTEAETMDIEGMIFDIDVCTNKYREGDGDGGYNYYLAFDKVGLITGANTERIPGLPTYDNVSLGDRFFTVRLRDNPKIVKYYSCREWWLGEPEEDDAPAETEQVES